MSADFYRRKAEWLDRLATDATLSPSAFRVAYVIGSFINRDSGKAWPTQETLATKTGLTSRAVRKQVSALVAGGHIICESGGGRHKPNVYRIADEETRNESSPFHGRNPEQKFPLSAGNPELSGQKPGTKVPTEPDEEPFPSSKAEDSASRTADGETSNLGDQPAENIVPLRPADPTDFRARLFAEGLPTLAAITDRKPASLRSLLGRWLKQTRDDAKAVLRAIEDARDEHVADPIARIEERLFGAAKRQPKSSFDPSFMFRRH